MTLKCEECHLSKTGCQPEDCAVLVGTLLELAEGKLPGIKSAANTLAAVAACLSAGGGCPQATALLIHPLACAAKGLVDYLKFASTQNKLDTYLTQLLGGIP